MKTFAALLLFSVPAVQAAEEKADLIGPAVGASDVLQLIFSLLAVIAVIVMLAWGLRRFGNLPGQNGLIRVIGGVSLGARERAVLVQAGDRQMLLGVAPGRVATLHVFDEPVTDLNPEQGSQKPFAEKMAAAIAEVRS